MRRVQIGNRFVGDGYPVYIVADIGINHNGGLATAKKLIDCAVDAGCDAVQFQKRSPELCEPRRKRIELGLDEYIEIDRYCKSRGIDWTASCWDEASLNFIKAFEPPFYKIAAVPHSEFLDKHRQTDRTLVLSTAMSTMDDIHAAVDLLGEYDLIIAHSTSSYSCPTSDLNLQVICSLRKEFSCPVGYSGHETALSTAVAAAAFGACYIERHLSLNCGMWDGHHAASMEPHEMKHLVMHIRNVEAAFGDGVKRVHKRPSEEQFEMAGVASDSSWPQEI